MEIEINNIRKRLGDRDVLSHVTLSMRSGNVYGFQGVNGSGKTMLMRAVCGLIRLSEGEILFDGRVLGRDISFPPSVGVLLEGPTFLDGRTGLDNLMLLAMLRGVAGEQEAREALASVGLDPDDRRKYRAYSLGMRQRLGIACAIFEDPELVVLDEPFNALDESGAEMVRGIIRALRDKGKLVMLSSHNRGDLEELSDTVFHLSEGRIVS